MDVCHCFLPVQVVVWERRQGEVIYLETNIKSRAGFCIYGVVSYSLAEVVVLSCRRDFKFVDRVRLEEEDREGLKSATTKYTF